MSKRNRFVLMTGMMLGTLLVCQPAVLASDGGGDDNLLAEIRELKKIVQQQQEKINQLEQRVTKQEAAPVKTGAVISESEIDRRIGERFKLQAPAYELMKDLSLSVGVTTVFQGANNANGENQLSGKEDVADPTLSTDIAFNKKFGDYGEGYVYISASEGAGIGDKLQVYSNVNADAENDEHVRVLEAWYAFYFQKISGSLAFGKLDTTNYIDTNHYANDETFQFLGNMFVNSSVVEFPSYSGGLHFGAAPHEFFDVNLVAVDADADWSNMTDSMFVAGQLNVKPKLLAKDGNYRIFSWINTANHTRWDDATRDKEKSYGYGASFDQELTDNVGVFARYGWQNPKVYLNGESFSLSQSWSLGPQIKGALWGRPDDVVGIGWGQVLPSKQYKKANDLLAKAETHLECYYNFKVNEHLSLSPDLQVIWQPYGKDAVNGDDTVLVGGMRGQMDF